MLTGRIPFNFLSMQACVIAFLKIVFRPFVFRWLGCQWEIAATAGIKQNYLVVANHTSDLDTLYVQYAFKIPIYFLTAQNAFATPVLKRVLRFFGAIPYNKAAPDIHAILQAKRAAKKGASIGVFVEGSSCWDGAFGKVYKGTGKLAKMLNLPIACVTLRGAHLTQPRWSSSLRRGRIIVDSKVIVQAAELAALSPQAIEAIIKSSLNTNDLTDDALRAVPFHGKNRAHRLEKLLYLCPECHSFSSLKSKKNHIFCHKCGFTLYYGLDCRLYSANKSRPVTHHHALNLLQQELLRSYLDCAGMTLPMEQDCLITSEPSCAKHPGKVALRSGVIFLTFFGQVAQCDIEKIEFIYQFRRDLLVLGFHGHTYQLDFPQEHLSPCLWYDAFTYGRENPVTV